MGMRPEGARRTGMVYSWKETLFGLTLIGAGFALALTGHPMLSFPVFVSGAFITVDGMGRFPRPLPWPFPRWM